MTGTDHASGSDRIGEVARRIEADVIVNLQGDEPFVEPDVIDAVVDAMNGEDPPDMTTAAVPLGNEDEYLNPDVVKVVVDNGGRALYFSRSPIPHGWKDGDVTSMRHLGIYAYRKEALLRFISLAPGNLERTERLEQLRALENGMRIDVVRLDAFAGMGIDRPEDIGRAEKRLAMHASRTGNTGPETAEEGP